MPDTLLAIAWDITYVLIIIGYVKHRRAKQQFIPPITVVLNYSWELAAFLIGQAPAKGVWLYLDTVIFIFMLYVLADNKKRLFYCGLVVALTAAQYPLFKLENGMLISSYVIALLMEIGFLVYVKKLALPLRIPIAVGKLVGDLLAWLACIGLSTVVFYMGIVLLAINTAYLIISVKLVIENKNNPISKQKRKKPILQHKKKRQISQVSAANFFLILPYAKSTSSAAFL